MPDSRPGLCRILGRQPESDHLPGWAGLDCTAYTEPSGTWQSLGLWAMAKKQRQHFPHGEESELGQEVSKKKVRGELYFPCRETLGKWTMVFIIVLSPKQIQKNIRAPVCPPVPHQGTPQKLPYPISKYWDSLGLMQGLLQVTGRYPGPVLFLALWSLFSGQHCMQLGQQAFQSLWDLIQNLVSTIAIVQDVRLKRGFTV